MAGSAIVLDATGLGPFKQHAGQPLPGNAPSQRLLLPYRHIAAAFVWPDDGRLCLAQQKLWRAVTFLLLKLASQKGERDAGL
jgi:hypothetical protein